ncbi:MAG: DNA polymerase III subunit delta' [Elusimicrobiota bacterium]
MYEKNLTETTNFPKVIGQTKALNIIDQALENKRLPHAYLFIGPKGVGKKTIATVLAQRLNCRQNTPLSAPCEICSSCRRIERGLHPDIKIIYPEEGYFKIDQILAIQSELQYKSWEKAHKVYILDEAETFTTEAANALLKTLEEPPDKVTLILTVERERKLLTTIVSRCQKIYFSYLPQNLVAEKISALRKISLGQAQILAQASEGSLGLALKLADDNFLEEREKTVVLWSRLKQLSLPEIIEESGDYPCKREELKKFNQTLLTYAREKFYQEPSRQHTKILERIILAQKELDQNLNVGLVRDNLFLDLAGLLTEKI